MHWHICVGGEGVPRKWSLIGRTWSEMARCHPSSHSVSPLLSMFLLECITAMYYFRMTESKKVLFGANSLWWFLSCLSCPVCDGPCPCEWNAQPLLQNVDKRWIWVYWKKMYICTTTTSEGWQKVDLSLLMANWKKCSWCTTGGPSQPTFVFKCTTAIY